MATWSYDSKPVGTAASLLDLFRQQTPWKSPNPILQRTLDKYLAGAKASKASCSLDFLLYALLNDYMQNAYDPVTNMPMKDKFIPEHRITRPLMEGTRPAFFYHDWEEWLQFYGFGRPVRNAFVEYVGSLIDRATYGSDNRGETEFERNEKWRKAKPNTEQHSAPKAPEPAQPKATCDNYTSLVNHLDGTWREHIGNNRLGVFAPHPWYVPLPDDNRSLACTFGEKDSVKVLLDGMDLRTKKTGGQLFAELFVPRDAVLLDNHSYQYLTSLKSRWARRMWVAYTWLWQWVHTMKEQGKVVSLLEYLELHSDKEDGHSYDNLRATLDSIHASVEKMRSESSYNGW